MDPHLSSYEFSRHFNNLSIMGLWPLEMQLSPFVKKVFLLIRPFLGSLVLVSIALEFGDLYFVYGNFRKVTFNLCTSTVVLGYPIKVLFILMKRKSLNRLRVNLWRDSLRLSSAEELEMKKLAYEELKYIRYFFYVVYGIFIPMVAITAYFSYLWGPRELPFAAYFPMKNPMDDNEYLPGLFLEVVCGFYVIIMVTEGEFAMYGLILQISFFYEVLLHNLRKINEIYGDDSDVGRENGFRREANVYLKKKKVEKWLKMCVIRHLELIQYAKAFEFIYSPIMLLQLSMGAFLIIINCFELSLYLHELNARFCFQMGFLAGIGIDFFIICNLISRLSKQCVDVGNTAYSTNWYKMEPELRKSFNIIMICSKKPPRITAGNIFHIDMPVLLSLARVTYSWVMLMRQLMVKESSLTHANLPVENQI